MSESCEEFNLDEREIAAESVILDTTLNERQISMLDYSIILINKLADIQLKNEHLLAYNKSLFDHKCVDALLSFFKRDAFLEKFSDTYDPHDKAVGILATLRNISENPFYEKQEWHNNKALEILSEFAPKCHFADTYAQILDEVRANIEQKSLGGCLDYLRELDDPARILDDEQVYANVFFMKFVVKNSIFRGNHFISYYYLPSIYLIIANSKLCRKNVL